MAAVGRFNETAAVSGDDHSELLDRMGQSRRRDGWPPAQHEGMWEAQRQDFQLFVSQFVIDEAGLGDPDAARRRLEALEDVPLLDPGDKVFALADGLMKRVPLPAKAVVDSLHIAIATVNGMDYLLTWNCTHIANATLRSRIELVCREFGYEPPVICTPEELLKE